MASNITRMPRGVPAQAQQQAAPGQQWWGGMPGWGGGGWWNGDCDDAIPPFPARLQGGRRPVVRRGSREQIVRRGIREPMPVCRSVRPHHSIQCAAIFGGMVPRFGCSTAQPG